MGFAYNEGDLYLSILMACVMGAVTIYTAREFDIPMTSAVVISACCGGLVFFGCGRFGKLGKKTRDFVSFDITVEGFGLFILTLFILSVIAFLITRVMRNQRVTREEIGLTARLLRQSDDFIRNCSEIGSTLREFDRPLVRKGATEESS